MRNHQQTMTVEPNGDVSIHGVDIGPHPSLHHVGRSGTEIVVKVPAHRRWSGIGQTANEPTKLIVYKVLEDLGAGDHAQRRFTVEEIADTPSRAQSGGMTLANRLCVAWLERRATKS